MSGPFITEVLFIAEVSLLLSFNIHSSEYGLCEWDCWWKSWFENNLLIHEMFWSFQKACYRAGCLGCTENCVLWWLNDDLTEDLPIYLLGSSLSYDHYPLLSVWPLSVRGSEVSSLYLCWGFWPQALISLPCVFSKPCRRIERFGIKCNPTLIIDINLLVQINITYF